MEPTPETYLTPKSARGEYEDRPHVKSVTVPEYIKRRVPSKHYVYKVVVNWTSGKQIIIYRKYSLFFDFVIKLNQMSASLSPELQKDMQLPELPGRVLFGRTEVHQVAEKRRRKIEEFCQKVVELPEEVSRSSLVLGFFNTWPADTLLRRPSIANTHVISAPVVNNLTPISETPNADGIRNFSSSSSSSTTGSASFSSPTNTNYEVAPVRLHQQPGPDSARSPSPLSLNSQSDCSALESIISHPDEMENLEQYLVLVDYERKDSHQVNLTANQHVYVIEKHDTGWWMVMSEDEQGYAPASYLEPVEGNSCKDEHLDEGVGQVYEAMESYFAENDDEITIKAGDKIEVISKSMDGWWMIRCNGHTGLSPAALIRRRPTSSTEEEQLDVFESEKDIYEGLNIHKPPPRRNTIDRSKTQNILAHYDTPRTLSEMRSTAAASKAIKPVRRLSNKQSSDDRPGLTGSLTSSSVDFSDKTEHIYESETIDPLYESAELDADGLPDTNGSIYENTEFMRESQKKKSTSQEAIHDQTSKVSATKGAARLKKRPKRHSPDDYEDPDVIMDEDYTDMDMDSNQEDQDQDNMYIDPEDLRKGNMDSSTASPESPLAHHNSVNGGRGKAGQLFDDDYIEMDPLYVEPPLESDEDSDEQDGGTLKANNNAKYSPKQSPITKRPLPPPPYSSPTLEEKSPLVKTKSLENIIAAFNAKGKGKQADSPKPDPKAKKVAPTPPPRVPSSTNSSSSVAAVSAPSPSTPEQSKSTKMKISARKMFSSGGGSKKRESEPNLMHEKVSLTKSISTSQERSNSPGGGATEGNSGGRIPRPPLVHTQSSPNMDVSLPKTFVSIASYTSPTKECLSFSEGDKCVLIQSSPDGWWLVNIGGQEGWTPGEYWKEDVREAQIPKPPSFAAPRKVPLGGKSRSQTVSDFTSSVEVSPSWTRAGGPTPSHEDSRGFNKSIDVFSSPSRATPTSASSSSRLKKSGPIRQSSDPKPQKPHKPILPSRPAIAAKPTNMKQSPRTSPTPNSPPTSKKRQGLNTPSPPPQLTASSEGMDARDFLSTAINGHRGNVKEPSPIADYEQLDELSTIEGSPWYCGKMERTQAEQYLMEHGRQREFLIRERTSKTGFYALSVRYHFSCKHFNIDPSPEGHYIMGVLTFPSIEHIIIHYQQNSLFIYDGQHVTLSQPVKKRMRASETNRHNH